MSTSSSDGAMPSGMNETSRSGQMVTKRSNSAENTSGGGLPADRKREAAGVGNLTVDERDVFLERERVVEAGVEILEQPCGDLAEAVELVQYASEKCLVEHGCRQRVGDLVAGDVADEDPEAMAVLQPRGDLNGAVFDARADSAVEVVAPVELDVDDVVPARSAVEKDRVPVDLNLAYL